MEQQIPQFPQPSMFDDDYNDVENNPRYAGDSRLFVTFYTKAVLNRFKSEQEARPIYDEKTYVRIVTAGDKNNIFDQPSEPIYERRFPKQFAAFKANKEQAVSGTPLEVWPQLTVGQIAELKALHVTTVEQLAELPDSLAQRIMGSHKLRQKAMAFLALAAGDSKNNQLNAELEKRDSEIEMLKNQLASMSAMIDKIKDDQNAKTEKPKAKAKTSETPSFLEGE